MAWWQKKFLGYCLKYIGVFDDAGIDLDNLDIALGQQSTIELRDVNLSTWKLTQLLQLPPEIRIETAKALRLKLTFPFNPFSGAVVFEVDDILVRATYEDARSQSAPKSGSDVRAASTQAPEHRKAHRRIGGSSSSDPHGTLQDGPHIPTAEDMARSFLLERPPAERKELEASLNNQRQDLEESMTSDSSEPSDLGTGTPFELPSIFANYVQGFLDRCQVIVHNVDVHLNTSLSADGVDTVPLELKLHLGSAALLPFDQATSPSMRQIKLEQMTLDLFSDAAMFSEMSELPSRASPVLSRETTWSPPNESFPHSKSSATAADQTFGAQSELLSSRLSESMHLQEEEADLATSQLIEPDLSRTLDIQAGDDNISWTSRRSQRSTVVEDLWQSTDDLPDSLLIESTESETPPAASPNPARHVRPISRSLQGPGSWPVNDDSAEQSDGGLELGTWPTLPAKEQTIPRQEVVPLDHPQPTPIDGDMHAGRCPTETLSSGGTDHDDFDNEDMTESKLYTHEEAQSLYMSAISHNPNETIESSLHESQRRGGEETPTGGYHGSETPRPASPSPGAEADTLKPKLVRKQILWLSDVSVGIPRSALGSVESPYAPSDSPDRPERSTYGSQAMPGTFSMHSDRIPATTIKRNHDLGSSEQQLAESRTTPSLSRDTVQAPAIAIGDLHVNSDFSVCRLLYLASLSSKSAVKTRAEDRPRTPKNDSSKTEAAWPHLSVTLRSMKLTLYERLPHDEQLQSSQFSLVDIKLQSCLVVSSRERIECTVQNLVLSIGNSQILSFGMNLSPPGSQIPAGRPSTPIFVLLAQRTDGSKTTTEVHLQTATVMINLDLPNIDRVLNLFGGMAGFLELSSLLSDSGTRSPVVRPQKGVRFEETPQSSGPELKVNGRFEALELTVRGVSSSMSLRTSTIKAVYREQAATATIESIVLTGPQKSGFPDIVPVLLEVTSLRLDYLPAPMDIDLERLLSLLTPSRNKYDSDDDILLDTLIRQRKKGPLARIRVGTINCKLESLEALAPLSALVEETTKLSAVAKYLPEDDRPGLLLLLRVSDAQAAVVANERIGKINVSLQDIHIAHVGLPSLLAVSINGVKADAGTYGELLHPLLSSLTQENLPMVMARMLGDEVEPTLRLKIFNLRVEYSVPILLALTGMDMDADVEEVVSELANSVADVALTKTKPLQRQDSPASEKAASKTTKIDLLILDSGIGLSPVNSPAKGILVLNEAKITTAVPEKVFRLGLQLRKSTFYVADKPGHDETVETRSNNSSGSHRLAQAMKDLGFVGICSVMKAVVSTTVTPTANDQQLVEVDMRNELLLLETCADSTQTMIGIFGGLTPPPGPEKQPKYLTEPMPIEDMMASFTGDAYTQPEQNSRRETLFDVDEAPEDDLLMPDDEQDDLLLESEMTSSLYGPIGNMLQGVDRPEDDDGSVRGEDWEGAVESLLEDDPFEMPSKPTDEYLSDTALIRDLNKQRKPALREGTTSLGFTEIAELGLETAGVYQNELGNVHDLNEPAAKSQPLSHRTRKLEYPFQLRLRDVHVIWNIYDGYDWQRTRNEITDAVEKVELQAEERKARRRQSRNDDDDESVIGDLLFNSIYIGVPGHQDAQELRRQINRNIDDLASETESVPASGISRPTTAYTAGGSVRSQRRPRRLKLERSRAHKVAFELKGLSADVLIMPPDSGQIVSTVDVRVRDFEIFDNVPTSTWRKFLTHLDSDPRKREMAKPMIHLALQNVKTNESSAAAEIKINVTVLPLRLHVDQDALDFITRFFEFKDEVSKQSQTSSEQPFIQRIEIDTVDLRLDYKPKRVDYMGLRSGHTSEFKNFVTLDAADIRLKHAIVYGIKGFEPLHQTLNDVWMPDIMRNQLPTVLSGLAPVRSLVNLGTGVRDVVAVPIREYRKDGRIVRSIQKGAFQFGKTTAAELARLGAKVAIGTQNILQSAEGALSGNGGGVHSPSRYSVRADDETEGGDGMEQRAISSYANQPLGVLSGLRSARQHLERDLLTVRDAFIAVQGEVLESGSAGAAAAAVARHGPTLILRPVIGASRAVGTTLLGVSNQIDRDNVHAAEEKYKHR